MRDRYREDGFVVVPGLLDPTALAPIRRTIERRVGELAETLGREGRIAETGEGLGFEDRLVAIARQTELPWRGWDEAVDAHELRALTEHPALVDAVAAVIGPDLAATGDWHLRPKLPGSELTAFPWHQDSQYYGEPTRHLHVVTAWIPLVDVDQRNGCLRLIPGSQRWGLQPGSRRDDMNMVTPYDVESRGTPVDVPMRLGDVLLFSNLTYHGSGVNRTPRVRWSLDLRYIEDPEPATLDPVRAEAMRFWFSAPRRLVGYRALRGRGVAAASAG